MKREVWDSVALLERHQTDDKNSSHVVNLEILEGPTTKRITLGLDAEV